MNALEGAFNQEKALVGAFSVIVQPVVEPMEHCTALSRSVSPAPAPAVSRPRKRQRSEDRSPSSLRETLAAAPRDKKRREAGRGPQRPHPGPGPRTPEHPPPPPRQPRPGPAASRGEEKGHWSDLTQFGVKDVYNEKKTTYYQYDEAKSGKKAEERPPAAKSFTKSRSETRSCSTESSLKEAKNPTGHSSILSQVNEIIKSCVKLKENKQISGEKLQKANMIIEKAKEKEKKVLAALEKKASASSANAKPTPEEGEITESEHDDSESKKSATEIVRNMEKEPETKRIVHIIRKQNDTKPKQKPKSRSRSRSGSLMTRSATKSSSRSRSRSRSRSWSRGRSLTSVRTKRSWRRSASRGRDRARRRSPSAERREWRERGRRTHYLVSRSRSRLVFPKVPSEGS